LKDMAKKLKQLPYEQLGIIDEAIEDAYDSIRPTSISTSAAIIPSDLTIASTKEKSKRAASSSSPPVTQRQRKPYKLSQQARGDLPVQLKQQAAKRRAVEYEDNDNEQDARETSTLVLPTPSELTSDPGSSTMSTSSARRRNPVVKLNLWSLTKTFYHSLVLYTSQCMNQVLVVVVLLWRTSYAVTLITLSFWNLSESCQITRQWNACLRSSTSATIQESETMVSTQS